MQSNAFIGLAYVVNETLDRAMLKSILYNQYLENGDAENGSHIIYGTFPKRNLWS